LAITQHRLAVSIGVPPRRINEIVHGTRRITPTRHCALHATSAHG
jgi:plasmid maintenance system antidote protein VapI